MTTHLANEPDDRADDAESHTIEAEHLGAPVDPPPARTTFADVVSRQDGLRPIVPATLRTAAGRHALRTYATAFALHATLYHLVRLPLYALRVLRYGIPGLWRMVARPVKWATAEDGNWHLRQQAANRGDATEWLALDARRQRQSSYRWPILLTLTVALIVAVGVVAYMVPAGTWFVAVVLTVVAARLGRPDGHSIVDRVTVGERFIRLTAQLTRAALVASGAGIKDPNTVKFNREIYRDGPGHTAEVTLPTGVIAVDVIDKRDYLAAGFQLPVAQVWPDPVQGAHPGVLAIWVADMPVDRMKQPASPLLESGPLDYWGPMPYGDDVRMRPISWRLDERNSLFGGMPGSGKTLAARNVALGAALDPLVQFAISELKGSGDFDAMERLCGDGLYASGADQGSKQRTMEILRWLDQECEVRGPLIRKWAAKGLNSQNKLNRAIAQADPRLRPTLGIFDEIQELVTDPNFKAEAIALLTSIVKRGRSLGIHLILATQRIDKESVPKGISSNVSNRLCLAVPSHVEVDLVLGTGAYRNGARPTHFVPPATGENTWAGWGCLAGMPQPVRAAYIDNNAAEAIVERALSFRSDLSTAEGERIRMWNLAEDVRIVWPLGEESLWVETILPRLAELRPDVYGGWTKDQLAEALRRAGFTTGPLNLRIDASSTKRSTRVGVRREELERVLAATAIDSGPATTR